MTTTGNTDTASEKGLLPNVKLHEKSRELDMLPQLKQNSLRSVCRLSDTGYTTIFHPDDGGVTVHSSEDIAIKVKKKQPYKGDEIKVGYDELPSNKGWTMISQITC